jgi:hypothetical protein
MLIMNFFTCFLKGLAQRLWLLTVVAFVFYKIAKSHIKSFLGAHSVKHGISDVS